MRAREDSRRSFVSAIRNLTLRRELLEMARVDQDVRNTLIQEGAGTPDPEVESKMAAVDSRNTVRIQEIVDQYRWPGPELVGKDGTEAAFLILQHASYDVQKALFPLVEGAYQQGILSGQNYAFLLDRLLVREGKPQVYGTQAKPVNQWNGSDPTFAPIDDG